MRRSKQSVVPHGDAVSDNEEDEVRYDESGPTVRIHNENLHHRQQQQEHFHNQRHSDVSDKIRITTRFQNRRNREPIQVENPKEHQKPLRNNLRNNSNLTFLEAEIGSQKPLRNGLLGTFLEAEIERSTPREPAATFNLDSYAQQDVRVPPWKPQSSCSEEMLPIQQLEQPQLQQQQQQQQQYDQEQNHFSNIHCVPDVQSQDSLQAGASTLLILANNTAPLSQTLQQASKQASLASPSQLNFNERMFNNEDLTGTQQSQIIPSHSSRNRGRNDSSNTFTDHSSKNYAGTFYGDNGDCSRRFDLGASVKTRDMWLPNSNDNRNDRDGHDNNYNNDDYHNSDYNNDDNDNDNNNYNSDYYDVVGGHPNHPNHPKGPSKGPPKEIAPIIPAMDRPSHWGTKPKVIKRPNTQADTKNKRSKGANGKNSLGSGGNGGRNGGGAGFGNDRSLAGTLKSRSLQSGMLAQFPLSKISVETGKLDVTSFQPSWMKPVSVAHVSPVVGDRRGDVNNEEIQEENGLVPDHDNHGNNKNDGNDRNNGNNGINRNDDNDYDRNFNKNDASVSHESPHPSRLAMSIGLGLGLGSKEKDSYNGDNRGRNDDWHTDNRHTHYTDNRNTQYTGSRQTDKQDNWRSPGSSSKPNAKNSKKIRAKAGSLKAIYQKIYRTTEEKECRMLNIKNSDGQQGDPQNPRNRSLFHIDLLVLKDDEIWPFRVIQATVIRVEFKEIKEIKEKRKIPDIEKQAVTWTDEYQSLGGNDFVRNDPHGNDPHGNDPHGNDPHGNDPHGNDPHGNDPHGNDPHGNYPTAEGPDDDDPQRKRTQGEFPPGLDMANSYTDSQYRDVTTFDSSALASNPVSAPVSAPYTAPMYTGELGSADSAYFVQTSTMESQVNHTMYAPLGDNRGNIIGNIAENNVNKNVENIEGNIVDNTVVNENNDNNDGHCHDNNVTGQPPDNDPQKVSCDFRKGMRVCAYFKADNFGGGKYRKLTEGAVVRVYDPEILRGCEEVLREGNIGNIGGNGPNIWGNVGNIGGIGGIGGVVGNIGGIGGNIMGVGGNIMGVGGNIMGVGEIMGVGAMVGRNIGGNIGREGGGEGVEGGEGSVTEEIRMIDDIVNSRIQATQGREEGGGRGGIGGMEGQNEQYRYSQYIQDENEHGYGQQGKNGQTGGLYGNIFPTGHSENVPQGQENLLYKIICTQIYEIIS